MRRNAGTIRSLLDEPFLGAGVTELEVDLREAVERGEMPAVDVDYMTAAMVGFAFEVGVRMVEREPVDVEGAARFATELFLGGIERLARFVTSAWLPTFCRHGRFIQNCPICREPDPPASATRAPRRSSGRRPSSGGEAGCAEAAPEWWSGGRPRARRRLRVAAGPGPERLGGRFAGSPASSRSAGRLAELATDPPGLYAEAAAEPDPEEGIWLALEITYLGPLDGEDPWAVIRAVRTPWSSGEVPSFDEDPPLGARTGHDPGRPPVALGSYRTWAKRAGGQVAGLAGEGSWSPERRFDRLFDRLSLQGLHRATRFEFLTVLGRLGRVEARAGSLKLSLADDVNLAAKRVFGIGDPLLLDRRASDLAAEAGIPLEALDLGLFNWGRGEGERARMGASDGAAAPRPDIESALGL